MDHDHVASDVDGKLQLFYAIGKNKVSKVEKLLKAGIPTDIIDKNNNDNTPLHYAVERGKTDIVKLLLRPDWHTDINVVNSKDETPLDIAATKHNTEIVQILEYYKRDLDQQSNIQKHYQASDDSYASSSNIEEVNSESSDKMHAQQDQLNPNDSLAANADTRDDQIKFNKRKGTGGICGQLYEIEILMLFLLEDITNKTMECFHLATNMEEAGDFDDIVFQAKYKDKEGKEKDKITFVQAKHRESAKKEISFETLLAKTENGDFLLRKYFASYREIKQQFVRKENARHPIFGNNFGDTEFIIYTNALLKYGKSDENNIEEAYIEADHIFNLNHELHKNKCYYQLKLDGSKHNNILDTLKYSSDCKWLAKQLAECIFSNKLINADKPIFAKYQDALLLTVLEKNGKEGKLRQTFLDGHKSLSSADETFRQEFLKEPQSGSIRLSEKFGDVQNESDVQRQLPDDLVNEDEIREFLSKLKLLVGQPNVDELSNIIQTKLQSAHKMVAKDAHLIFCDVHNKIQTWWKAPDCYLTENSKLFENAKLNFSKLSLAGLAVLRTKEIKASGVEFKEDRVDSLVELIREVRILNIVTNKRIASLTNSMVHQALETMMEYKTENGCYKYIRLSLSSVCNLQTSVIEAFRSKESNLLVIECEAVEQNIDALFQQLSEIIKTEDCKRIVIITQEDDRFSGDLKSFFKHHNYKEHIDQEYNLTNLTHQSQEHILNIKEVTYQGKLVRLENVVDDPLKHLINGEVVSESIRNGEITIGNPPTDTNYADVNNYYVDRTFKRHLKITNKIKEDESEFYVIDIDVDPKIILPNLQQHRDIILIDGTHKDFVNLCNRENNVHWLKKDDEGNYIWQKSRGAISKLRKFVEASEQSVATNQPKNITDIPDRLVIVAAQSGMGKSAVLSHLAVETTQSLWVVRSNLLDYSAEFKHWNEESKSEIGTFDAIKFLYKASHFQYFEKVETTKQEEILNNILAVDENCKVCVDDDRKQGIKGIALFEIELFTCFYNQGKIAVLLDGFDEILPNHKKVVMILLEKLKVTNVAKLWVTTRPYNIQSDLEDMFSAFPYELKPFDEKDQEQFLENFWTQSVEGDELDNRSKAFIDELLHRFSESTNDRDREFVGVPLQIWMIATIFQNTFTDFYKSGRQHLSDDDKMKLSKDLHLATLYERFVEMKFKESIRKETPHLDDYKGKPTWEYSMEKRRQKLIKEHQRTAFHALFKDDDWRKLLTEKEEKDVQKSIETLRNAKEKAGIMGPVIDGKAVFIHRTFAEYFVAGFICDKLKSSPPDGTIWDFFINSVLTENHQNVIRRFLDSKISNDPDLVNLSVGRRKIVSELILKQNSDENALSVAAKEGLRNIFVFLLRSEEDVEIKKLTSLPKKAVVVLCNTGRYSEANKILANAFKFLTDELGANHLEIAILNRFFGNSMVVDREDEEDLKKKQQFLEEGLKIFNRHLNIADGLDENTCFKQALSTFPEAFQSFGIRRAEHLHELRDVWICVLEIEIARAERNLGNAHFPKTEETRKCLEKALATFQKHLPFVEKHKTDELLANELYSDIGKTMRNIGNMYVNLADGKIADYNKAKDILKSALCNLKKYFIPNQTFEVAKTQRDLGIAYGKLNKHDVKTKWIEKALHVLRKHFGYNNIEATRAQKHLGDAYECLGYNLHGAVVAGKLVEVEKLVDLDQINTVYDRTGLTPLHLAAREGHLDILKLLLSKQADRNIRDKCKKSPLDLAEENLSENPEVYQQIIDILKQKSVN